MKRNLALSRSPRIYERHTYTTSNDDRLSGGTSLPRPSLLFQLFPPPLFYPSLGLAQKLIPRDLPPAFEAFLRELGDCLFTGRPTDR
jgi:hypothetical protein